MRSLLSRGARVPSRGSRVYHAAMDLFGEDDPSLAPGAKRFAQVALEQSIDASGGLTYAVPDALSDLAVGERVVVPLGRGNKPAVGFVIGVSDQPDPRVKRVKWVASREVGGVSLTGELVELARWIAGYYVAPLGMVFMAMLPAAVKHGTGSVRRALVRPASPTPDGVRLTKLQRAIVEAAKAAGDFIELKQLADAAGAKTVGPVRQLVDKGVLEVHQARVVVSDLDLRASAEASPPVALELNAGQRDALSALSQKLGRGFGVHLLHGVTGSGKTEVYLRVIERLREADPHAGVIVLVPEIALTPQTVGRFFGRFDADRVAVLHSGLTAAQRHQQWRRIRNGEAAIVVGARSAIFAPLPRVGLIVVDEEHESSYKQDQVPRYHARDVAIKRAQLHDVPVILGSATPSLESWHNAQHGRFALLSLPERAPGMKMPEVEIVDLVKERTARRGVHLISQRLEMEIGRVLGRRLVRAEAHGHLSARALDLSGGTSGGRVILLLNRRGYANYIACPDHRCGWMMGCERCDVTVVYHRDASLPAGGLVRCHHCDAEQLLPELCPVCARKVTVFGLGTQRVEEELAKKFPGIRTARMDSDSMRSAKDYQRTLDAFREGSLDVLLGTQMIAKGLDFPSVRLVGVISGDTSLHMPDFRAAERTFQLIAQVAGRAGRSGERGRVIVQTFSAQDPVIALAAAHDYVGFATRELQTRAEVGLPPVGRMARIVVRDRDHVAATVRARALADHLEAFNDKLGGRVRIRGPMACPIARVAEHHRIGIDLLAPPPDAAATLQRLLTALRNTGLLISDGHTAVDVDPVALL
jgi:primosomal protein N' (replication factor Y)